jgi:hypothetical protein
VPLRLHVSRWARLAGWPGAGWLAALCVLGAAYVSVILGAPGVLVRAGGGLAAAATVAFGSQLGRRRDWRSVFAAAIAGTVVLVCWAEAALAATFFVPYAGGSGGFLVILAPLFLAGLAGAAALALLVLTLGASALMGLALARTAGLRVVTALIAMLAGAAIVALPAPEAGQFGVVVTPTRSAAAGIWTGPRGATLMLASEGAFTARHLPAGIGEWASGSTPVSGGGTWHIGRFGPDAPAGVILDFSDGSQAELQIETAGPALAMYYDLGDPDEGWSGQYRFVKQ